VGNVRPVKHPNRANIGRFLGGNREFDGAVPQDILLSPPVRFVMQKYQRWFMPSSCGTFPRGSYKVYGYPSAVAAVLPKHMNAKHALQDTWHCLCRLQADVRAADPSKASDASSGSRNSYDLWSISTNRPTRLTSIPHPKPPEPRHMTQIFTCIAGYQDPLANGHMSPPPLITQQEDRFTSLLPIRTQPLCECLHSFRFVALRKPIAEMPGGRRCATCAPSWHVAGAVHLDVIFSGQPERNGPC